MDEILSYASQPKWVTSLSEIEIKTESLREANQSFSEFLKTQEPEKIDQLVAQISRTVAQDIDCTKCANCCRSLTVGVNYPDMQRLAGALNTEINEFKTKFMKKDPNFADWVFQRRPCPFLKKDKCSVYEDRPSTCRSYPHLEKAGFIGRLGNITSNLKVCPIAFNTFEVLKLNFE